jgi:hypothetical protein
MNEIFSLEKAPEAYDNNSCGSLFGSHVVLEPFMALPATVGNSPVVHDRVRMQKNPCPALFTRPIHFFKMAQPGSPPR